MTKNYNHAKLSPMEAVLETRTTFCQGMNVKICVWLILMPLKKCVTSILTLALEECQNVCNYKKQIFEVIVIVTFFHLFRCANNQY